MEMMDRDALLAHIEAEHGVETAREFRRRNTSEQEIRDLHEKYDAYGSTMRRQRLLQRIKQVGSVVVTILVGIIIFWLISGIPSPFNCYNGGPEC
jgi:hypothetical protein